MIIVMQQNAQPNTIEAVVNRVEGMGYKVHLSRGEARTIIGVIGADEHRIEQSQFEAMDGVEKTMRVMQPFKAASRDFSHGDTVIDVNGVLIGGTKVVVMAGPCAPVRASPAIADRRSRSAAPRAARVGVRKRSSVGAV